MSSPLIFVRDERDLPYFPVTLAALEAIRKQDLGTRLPYAISLYVAILELANDARSARVEAPRRELVRLAGISRRLVSELAPVLQKAGVLKVEEQFYANSRLENVWTVIEPLGTERAGVGTEPQGGRHGACQRDQEVEEVDVVLQSTSTENGNDRTPTALERSGSTDRSGRARARQEVFDHWQQTMGKSKAKLNPDRQRIINGRLDRFSVDDLKRAIDAASRDEFLMGDNPQGKVYNDFSTIFRNDSKVEGLLEQADNPPQKPMTAFEKAQAELRAIYEGGTNA